VGRRNKRERKNTYYSPRGKTSRFSKGTLVGGEDHEGKKTRTPQVEMKEREGGGTTPGTSKKRRPYISERKRLQRE